MNILRPTIARMGEVSEATPCERGIPFFEQCLIYRSDGALRDAVQRAVAARCYPMTGRLTTPSDILYHYTSRTAFESIIRSGSFWASHHSSMNDRKEIEYSWDLLLVRAGNYLQTTCSKVDHVKSLRERIVANLDYYFISFSRVGNLLSQWRAYAWPDGVSFGLPSCMFPRFTADYVPYRLCDVVYDVGRQCELLDPLARKLAVVLDAGANVLMSENDLVSIKSEFASVAPVVKHPSFAEEQEVRLISDGTSFVVKERSRKNDIVKYIEVSFMEAFKATPFIDLPVWDIYTSPSEDPDSSVERVYDIMRRYRMKFTTISDCGIPLR